MKKLFLLIMMFGIVLPTIAQNDTIIYIANEPQNQTICPGLFDRVLVYGLNDCYEFYWTINGQTHHENPIIINVGVGELYEIEYYGCNFICGFNIWFEDDFLHLPNPITQTVWKHQYETLQLQPVGNDSLGEPYWYEYLWSTGSTEPIIEVTEPGIYTCEMSVPCGSATRTFIVRDNVELYRATCDLETNLNMVTWPTTPAQAEYVSQVEIKRDGLIVGTAPYTDGQFIDNIGSDAASRTYTVTAIATDGTPCPITSYPKETIHMAYLTGINNTIEVNWNTPTGYDLLGYNICEWNANDGTLTTIDYVGASVTSYTCQQSQFDQGYIVIQGVEAGKDGETRLLSNRSSETVGVEENGTSTGSGALTVYPNPAKGAFTVEGTGQMTITNVLGQTALTREIDGKGTIELSRGIYFVKLNGATRKIVVE